jgi:radical SAM protein with 4Fe4S-binding SPASM domain
MDWALFKKIIDECSQHQDIERILLYLNNEPLTDPYLVERINYAKEKLPWGSVHILTNASLLTKKLSQELIDSKLDWIGFSLHGIKKETIEKTMRLNYDLTFKRALNFIEKAKSKRNIQDFIMITFLRHKYLALEEKDEAIKFWRNKGIERISYFDSPISRAGNVGDLPCVKHNKVKGCTSIWADEMIHIVENGEVILCCMDWRREIILGNLNKQSIYEIWNSQLYNQVRNKRDGRNVSSDKFICKKCEAAIPYSSTESLIEGTIKEKAKKPDILLVICPMWGTNFPPLGISYLHSYLKQKGFLSSVMDINIDLFKAKILALFDDKIDFYASEILAHHTKIIGFSVNAGNLLFSIELAKRIKAREQNKIIIFGGAHSKWFKYDIDYLEQYQHVYPGFYTGLVDIFVIGEGEITLERILYSLKNNKEIDNIPGVILCKNNHYLCSQKENFIWDLDSLPFPDFSWSDSYKYTENKLPILMSRGCIRKCLFCNDTFVSAKYRSRSAKSVFEEMVLRLKRNKVRNFEFCDLILNANLRELERLCDLIIKAKIHINWIGQAGIRKDFTKELLTKMKKAGCSSITYGVESFSNRTLELMNKPYKYENVQKVIKDTAKAKIPVYINIITGFPGEGEREFNETVQGIKDCHRQIKGISSLAPSLITLGSYLQRNLSK